MTAVAQYREQERTETALWGIHQITKHKQLGHQVSQTQNTVFKCFCSIFHRHIFPADSTAKTLKKPQFYMTLMTTSYTSWKLWWAHPRAQAKVLIL